LFFDEAFFKRETSLCRGWYIKGSRPEVQSDSNKEKIGTFSSVNIKKGELYSMVCDEFDSDTFIEYLKLLLSEYHTGRKIVLVLDNASPHKSKKTKAYIKSQEAKIELLYLPPYSPDLNPAELVWKDIRACRTHNRYFATVKELLKEIMDYLKTYSISNEKIKQLCAFNYVV
jgi:transposase